MDRTMGHDAVGSATVTMPPDGAVLGQAGYLEVPLGVFRAWGWAFTRPRDLFTRIGAINGVYGDDLIVVARDVPSPLFVAVLSNVTQLLAFFLIKGDVDSLLHFFVMGGVGGILGVVLLLAIQAAVFRLVARLVGRRVPYSVAYSVVGYAASIPQFAIVGPVWSLVLVTKGLRYAAGLSSRRAYVGVGIWIVLWFWGLVLLRHLLRFLAH